jgi:hypothetical protein
VLKKNRKWIKKIISMSNRMKMMVRKKNWRDRGIRTFLKFSIPHSKGRIFSFKKYLKSLSKNITAKKVKKNNIGDGENGERENYRWMEGINFGK